MIINHNKEAYTTKLK